MHYQVEIKMLNVQDGDAIIIVLTRNEEKLLVLIDGGHTGDTATILKELDKYLTETGKKAPDLIVCTHYDNDHIGGLYRIISHFKTSIAQVWIHNTSSLFALNEKLQQEKKPSIEKSSILPSEDDIYLACGTLESIIHSQDESTQLVIETLRQEIELVSLINDLKLNTIEPISDSCEYKDWPEIKLIGPTMEYYQKLFPKHFNEMEYLKDEAIALKEENISVLEPDLSPCQLLDSLPKSKLTATNLNSAIILIEIGDKKFLFTGDAGIDSFYAIPGHENLLRNIYWLKVPHHASKNNINCNLIKLMNPIHSFVSGNKLISEAVIGCLKDSGSEVSTTRDKDGHLSFSETFNVE